MSSSPLGAFGSFFSVRDLIRGSLRTAVIWALVTTGVCGLLLVASFLLVSSLHNEGVVWLSTKDRDAYLQIWDPNYHAPEEVVESDIGRPARIGDQGLRVTTWEVRNRSWFSLLRGLVGTWSGFETTSTTLFFLVLCCPALGMIHGALSLQIATQAATAASRIAIQLRVSLHRHALRMGTSDLANTECIRTDELFDAEVETVRRGIAQSIERLLIHSGRLLVVIPMLLVVDPKLGFECAVPAAGCLYLVGRMRHRDRDAQKVDESRAESEMQLLTEGMHSSRLIKGYLLDDYEGRRFDKELERHESRGFRMWRRFARQQFLTRLLGMGCATFVVSMVSLRLLTEVDVPGHLTLAESTFIVTLLVLGWRAIDRLQVAHQECLTARDAADRIQRFVNTIPPVSQAVGAKFLQPLQKSLQIENITYRIGQRTVLDRLSLKLPAGSSTAIVAFDPLEARVLAALLPRFIEPNEGRILIDGEDTALATLESLRMEILTVDDDAGHLTGTIFENLSGGDAKYTLTRVTEAAKEAHAHNFIQKMQQGYETVIGEHGDTLDAGQTFRLSLARAILRDPALLIIREPQNNLSEDDKSLIDDTCRRLVKDRTVLFLSPRLPTIKQADRIVLLNRGKVEALGTHEVLVKSSALYQHWEYMHFNELRHTISHPE